MIATSFQTADTLPAAPSRIEELEELIRKQAEQIEERDTILEGMCGPNATARPERTPAEILKDSERLMLLARIQDLTLMNQALEIELRGLIKGLQEEVSGYKNEMVYDKKRIAKLEDTPLTPTEKRTERLDKLDKLLLKRKNDPLTFAEVGKLLELGSRSEGKKGTRRQAMTKFSKILLSNNDLYDIYQSKTVNSKLIRLTDSYYKKIVARGRSVV